MSKIFDERLVTDEATKENIIYDEHLIRYKLAGEMIRRRATNAAHSNEGVVVLDIATGTGYGAKILAQKGAKEVIAVDIDEKAIEKAKEVFGEDKIKYITSDCLNTGFEDKKFDVIVSFETIEHLKNQDKYLEELKRILKDDGLIIVSTPNREVFGNKNPFHTHEFTKQEFEEKLKKYFQYCHIFEQRNALVSCVQISEKKEARIYQGKKNDPFYFIAFCSNKEIKNILSEENYLSVNYLALENMNNNPGFKLVNKVYSFLVKIPGVKNIFEKIRS